MLFVNIPWDLLLGLIEGLLKIEPVVNFWLVWFDYWVKNNPFFCYLFSNKVR